MAGSAEIVKLFDVLDAPRRLHRVPSDQHVHRTLNKQIARCADNDHTDSDIKDQEVLAVG